MVNMRRRAFITLLGGAATAWPMAARAQQAARPPRMAMFHPAIAPALLTETGGGSAWRAFFGELRRLGYVEGQSLIIERYWAEGRHDRYAEVAREIVTRNPDVIVTGTNPVVTVFKAATGTIPIVAFMLDPLQAGLVSNLHRPGGNLTGITLDAGIEIWGKRLEFLKEAIPSMQKARIPGDARRMGRVCGASLAGCRRAFGNFAGFCLPAGGETPGD
jgi:putative tryptophan/tyrosine transport system substrate-binding protein